MSRRPTVEIDDATETITINGIKHDWGYFEACADVVEKEADRVYRLYTEDGRLTFHRLPLKYVGESFEVPHP